MYYTVTVFFLADIGERIENSTNFLKVNIFLNNQWVKEEIKSETESILKQ